MLNNKLLLMSGDSGNLVKPSVTAPGGQKLALNSTSDGVLVWYTDPYDNVEKLMAVGPASIRTTREWSIADSNIPDLPYVPVGSNDANTAKFNTDKIVAYGLSNYTSTAATACRNKTIGGNACSLPNKQQLVCIWNVRTLIDSLDPTAASRTTFKLSNWGFGANGGAICWSSTVLNINSGWRVTDTGGTGTHLKTKIFGIIPVLELDPITQKPL